MKAVRRGDEITLSGPPRHTAVVVPIDLSAERIVPISISVANQPAIYRAVVRAFGSGKSEILLRLPGDTPPGKYTGEGTVGGKTRAIVVEVEPDMRLRVQPKQTLVSVAASSRVEFSLSVLNGGNVPFDVPKSGVLDLDDAAGQDLALGRTLRASLSRGERRVDRYFEELREGHAGEARVTVRNGAGRLEPGDSRELTCVLDVPAVAKEGRLYVGAWQIGNVAHVIVAEIRTGTQTRNGRTKQ